MTYHDTNGPAVMTSEDWFVNRNRDWRGEAADGSSEPSSTILVITDFDRRVQMATNIQVCYAQSSEF